MSEPWTPQRHTVLKDTATHNHDHEVLAALEEIERLQRDLSAAMTSINEAGKFNDEMAGEIVRLKGEKDLWFEEAQRMKVRATKEMNSHADLKEQVRILREGMKLAPKQGVDDTGAYDNPAAVICRQTLTRADAVGKGEG